MVKAAAKSEGAGGAAVASVEGNGGEKPANHRLIRVDEIRPDAEQARQTWDTARDEDGKTSLDRLAESIAKQGLLNALVVTPQNGHFSIVCGERRWRAIKNHNLMKEVPCLVVEGLTPAKKLEMNLVENLQREDLTPMDEAHAYRALMEKCGYTQATLAKRLGVSGAMVSYKLSLLDLSPGLQKEVAKGRLSETDGRAIAQTVKRIGGPEASRQRAEAQGEIEKEIKEAPTNGKNGKVDTPTVKRVTEAAVARVAGSKALPQVRAPKAVGVPPAPSAPVMSGKTLTQVKEHAEHLMTAIKDVSELLKPSRRALADKEMRKRVIGYLLAQHPLLPGKIRAALSPLDVVYDEATQALDGRAKKGAKAAPSPQKEPKGKATEAKGKKTKKGK